MFSYKIHKQGNDILVAVADADLVGKTIKHNDLSIEVGEFYSGKRCGNEILEIVKDATIVNAIGNKIVNLLVEHGLVDKDSTVQLGDVLHAQIVKV